MHAIRSPYEHPYRHGSWTTLYLMITYSWTKERKKLRTFLEFNENEGTTYPNLCDTMKAVLRKTHSSECLQKETGESIH